MQNLPSSPFIRSLSKLVTNKTENDEPFSFTGKQQRKVVVTDRGLFPYMHIPLVSGLAMTTLTPGSIRPDSMRHRLFGAPRSTCCIRSYRSDRVLMYTVDASCIQIAMFTLEPNDVLTYTIVILCK